MKGEDYYENANAFVPERWYSRMEMVKDQAAFIPFSCGTYRIPNQTSWVSPLIDKNRQLYVCRPEPRSDGGSDRDCCSDLEVRCRPGSWRDWA